jgi:hypothetical protein
MLEHCQLHQFLPNIPFSFRIPSAKRFVHTMASSSFPPTSRHAAVFYLLCIPCKKQRSFIIYLTFFVDYHFLVFHYKLPFFYIEVQKNGWWVCNDFKRILVAGFRKFYFGPKRITGYVLEPPNIWVLEPAEIEYWIKQFASFKTMGLFW